MDSTFSSLAFLLLGSLALSAGLSAKRWQPEEKRLRIGALAVGLIFVIMGILGLMKYVVITGGS